MVGATSPVPMVGSRDYTVPCRCLERFSASGQVRVRDRVTGRASLRNTKDVRQGAMPPGSTAEIYICVFKEMAEEAVGASGALLLSNAQDPYVAGSAPHACGR